MGQCSIRRWIICLLGMLILGGRSGLVGAEESSVCESWLTTSDDKSDSPARPTLLTAWQTITQILLRPSVNALADLKKLESVLAVIQEDAAQILPTHFRKFWLVENILGRAEENRKALTVKAPVPQHLALLRQTFNQIITQQFVAWMKQDLAAWQRYFAQQNSLTDLAVAWSRVQFIAPALVIWAKQQQQQQLAEKDMAQRMPDIFNVFLQELAHKLQALGLDFQYKAPTEKFATGEVLITPQSNLSSAPIFSSAPSSSSSPSPSSYDALLKIWRGFVLEILLQGGTLRFADPHQVILQNATEGSFIYDPYFPGWYKDKVITLHPAIFWQNLSEGIGVLLHEQQHLIAADHQLSFAIAPSSTKNSSAVQGDGEYFFNLTGQTYSSFFSVDELAALKVQNEFYVQVINDTQYSLDLGAEEKNILMQTMAENFLMADALAFDAQIILEDVLNVCAMHDDLLTLTKDDPYLLIASRAVIDKQTKVKIIFPAYTSAWTRMRMLRSALQEVEFLRNELRRMQQDFWANLLVKQNKSLDPAKQFYPRYYAHSRLAE